MSETQALLLSKTDKLSREELALVPTPPGTATHRPIPHAEIAQALIETLGFRHINVASDQYAVSRDGNDLFGVMELDQGMDGARFALGIRNSNAKRFRFSITVGYRVFVCDNLAFHGDFEPVLAKHSKNFNLIEAISVGVDQMQRNFRPMVEAVDRWRETQLSDVAAKLYIYEAFIEGNLDVPRHLGRTIHDLYFNPRFEEFRPRTKWSLSNAFTSSFEELAPIPKFKATAKLGTFLNARIA